MTDDKRYHFDGLEFDCEKLRLSREGETVDLFLPAARLLAVLLRNANQLVSRDDALEAVWPGEEKRYKALNPVVSQLRAAIGDRDKRRIETVRKPAGYRFWLTNPAAVNAGDRAELKADQAACGAFLNRQWIGSMSQGHLQGLPSVSNFEILDGAASALRKHGKSLRPPARGMVWRRLGEAYLRLAYSMSANEAFEAAVQLLAPAGEQYADEALIAQFCQVRSLIELYDIDRAERLFERANSAAGLLVEGRGPVAIYSLVARVDLLLAKNEPKRAIPFAEKLVQIVKADDPIFGADVRVRLVEIYVRLEDLENSKRALDLLPSRASKIVAAVTRARVAVVTARVAWGQRQVRSAIRTLLQAEKEAKAALSRAGKAQIHIGYILFNLADYQTDEGEFDLAAKTLEEAQQYFERHLDDPRHSHIISVIANAAIADLLRGNPAKALKGFNTAAELWRQPAADFDPFNFYRGWIFADQGDFEAAHVALRKVRHDRLAVSSWGPPDWEWRLQAERGYVLAKLGRVAEGKRLLEAAIPKMREADSLPWVLKRHQRQLREVCIDQGPNIRGS